MSHQQNRLLKPGKLSEFEESFIEDMAGICLGFGRGEAGKYMYDNFNTTSETNLWEEIVKASSDYYVPKADSELFQQAQYELAGLIPAGIPYVDFGVGGIESFKRYVLPTMKILNSHDYYGVDFDQKILEQIENSRSGNIHIATACTDFFEFSHATISPRPALGVMNGITIGNMYGALNETDVQHNLVLTLKYLMQLTNYGWLLISVDTNQDPIRLMKMYLTPLNSHLNMASLARMQKQLPVTGFDATLFSYEPEWLPDRQLFAHLATPTQNQNFVLGDYEIEIIKGKKLHLFNSYKFKREFFEACCIKAELAVYRSWQHETGVMLYLLSQIA